MLPALVEIAAAPPAPVAPPATPAPATGAPAAAVVPLPLAAGSARRFVLHLVEQHREVEARAAELRRRLEAHDWMPALAAFDRLEAALARHDDLDDTVVLPLVARSAPALAPQLAYVRAQRQACATARRRLAERLFDDDCGQLIPLADELYALVCASQLLEECLLGGAIEAALTRSAT